MKSIILLFFISITLYSCNKNRTTTQNNSEKDIPKVLTEDKSENYERLKSSSPDLVESLYEDLIKNDEKLKELDENINKNFKAMSSVIQEFNEYRRKSIQYYSNAESNASLVKDSLLEFKTKEIVKNSREKFNQLISNLSDADSTINSMYFKIKDNYEVFKIQKTLPIIEKYQKEKLPENKKLEDFIKEQNKLLEKIK